ncbi:hypothetical protein NFI96_007315 [Prochilodus magdalenae]|nr:hypothetical protein NFI96_007315 [Prochilodus magdalenae]
MAHILFSNSSYLYSNTQEEHSAGKIRLSIFLTAGLCGGLPALVWGLRVLYDHYKSGGRISALVIRLLLCDLLELLLSPYVVAKLLQNDYCWDSSWTCRLLTSLWSTLMIYGFHVQQVVALEAAFSFRHPPCSAHAVFPSCSIIISIIVFIYFLLCEAFGATLLVVLILPLLIMITVTSCIVTCRAPAQINNIPYRTRRPSSTVLAFVTSTLILYGTFTSVCAVTYIVYYLDHQMYSRNGEEYYMGRSRYAWHVFVMGVCLMSLNVIIDPLLCVLVCRRPTDLIKPQVNI